MFETTKTMVQLLSTCLSLTLNPFLIIVILKKSPSTMGNYRYLMIYFSCSAMVFSLLDSLTQPYVHSIGKCFVVVVKIGFFGRQGTLILLCALCACFGVTITCFAIHFAYRFFALERMGRLRFFSGYNLIFSFMLPILVGVFWGTLVYIFLGPNYTTSMYIEESIYDHYQLRLEEFTYIAALYFFKDNTPHFKHLTGSGILVTIMLISFSIVIQYGVRSFILIKKLLRNEGESEFSRNLQKQLYKALVIQSLFPLFLMYLPIGFYMIFPITGINIQEFSRFVTFIYALYPAVDLIPIIFIVDCYRSVILKPCYAFGNQNRVQDISYTTPDTIYS